MVVEMEIYSVEMMDTKMAEASVHLTALKKVEKLGDEMAEMLEQWTAAKLVDLMV
jgi:hypothetical protein